MFNIRKKCLSHGYLANPGIIDKIRERGKGKIRRKTSKDTKATINMENMKKVLRKGLSKEENDLIRKRQNKYSSRSKIRTNFSRRVEFAVEFDERDSAVLPFFSLSELIIFNCGVPSKAFSCRDNKGVVRIEYFSS